MKKYLFSVISAFFCLILFSAVETKAQKAGSVTQNIAPVNPSAMLSNVFNEQAERKMMKADGLSEIVIDKLISDRKKLISSGRKVEWRDYNNLRKNIIPNTSWCDDIGVENGWGAWNGAPGQTNGGNPCTFTVSVNPPVSNANTCFNLTSGKGIDSCSPGVAPGSPPLPVVAPGFGKASIQIGCPELPGCYAEQITYQLTPTAQDTTFLYSYAVVLYDPGSSHAPNEKPFVNFVILDQIGDTVPCSFMHIVANSNIPGFYPASSGCTGGSSTWYKPWTIGSVNLVNYIGQQLTVIVTNADCSQCGHFAHSYWDFACSQLSPLSCTGQQITLCAPDTFQNNYYQWYHNSLPYANSTGCISPIAQAGDTFSVLVVPSLGCTIYLKYVLQDTCLTAVEENIFTGVNIFPNPASENIFIDFGNKNFGKAEIIFTDVLGKTMISEKKIAIGKYNIDVSSLSKGSYFVRINTGEGSVTRKVVISR